MELIPIGHKKSNVFYIKNLPHIIVKIFRTNDFVSEAKVKNEIRYHKMAQRILNSNGEYKVPRILDLFWVNSYSLESKFSTCYVLMERLNAMSIADFYGENPEDVPDFVWQQIWEILRVLKFNNLIYNDITPYNFMIDDDGNVYVIDFEHVTENHNSKSIISEYVDVKKWNPDFK